jgi:glycosyltransferase involved in cell wall biosynthesis
VSTTIVMTALNNQDTFMEATEAILSQRGLADQFGLVLGPSRDGTTEFAEFYREELDFIDRVRDPTVSSYGRGRLRLRGLESVNSTHVLFVPADVFLYPDSLDRYKDAVDPDPAPDCVLAPMNIIDRDGSATSWGPDQLGAESILSAGPINPATALFRTAELRERESTLRQLRCGPFTTLSWVLTVLSDMDARATVLEEPVAERWSFSEGPRVWDRSVVSGLLELIYVTEQFLPDRVPQLLDWFRRAETVEDDDDVRTLEQMMEDVDLPSGDSDRWLSADVPFSE